MTLPTEPISLSRMHLASRVGARIAAREILATASSSNLGTSEMTSVIIIYIMHHDEDDEDRPRMLVVRVAFRDITSAGAGARRFDLRITVSPPSFWRPKPLNT